MSYWSPVEYAEFISKEPLEPSTEDIEAMKNMKLNRGQFLAFKFGKMKIKEIVDETILKVMSAADRINLIDNLVAHEMRGVSPNPVFLSAQLLELATELDIGEDVMADVQVNNIALIIRDRNIFEFINGRDENPERRKVRIEIKIAEEEGAGGLSVKKEGIRILYKGLIDFMNNVVIFTVDKQIDPYRYY